MSGKKHRLPDIAIGVAAAVAGMAAFVYLNGKWYHGGWMSAMGDPPMINPAYATIAPLFHGAPYAAAGLTSGLLAGQGLPHARRLALRGLTGPGLLSLLFLLMDAERWRSFFAPVALLGFAGSVALCTIYRRLLSEGRRPGEEGDPAGDGSLSRSA